MNKIDRKVLSWLDAILSFSSEMIGGPINESTSPEDIEFIIYLSSILKSTIEESYSREPSKYVFDSFGLLHSYLVPELFSSYEVGYITNKLLRSNYFLIDHEGKNFIRVNLYHDDIRFLAGDDYSLDTLVSIYLEDSSMQAYQGPNRDKLSQLIKYILEEETKHCLLCAEQYTVIREFDYKVNKISCDYEKIYPFLRKLGLNDNLIDAYFTYQKNRKYPNDKKTYCSKSFSDYSSLDAQKDLGLSKRELKTGLAEYYSDKEDKDFDYVYFQELLKILKELNYSDKYKDAVFSSVFRHGIKNYSFYRYVMDKILFMKKSEDIQRELEVILASMVICSSEDYEFYKRYAIELLDSVQYHVLENFDYEAHLMRKL